MLEINQVKSREEEIMSQLEESWPKTLNYILEMYPEDEFYIFTFVKKDTHTVPMKFNVYHQPRTTKPEKISGTILQKINRKNGTSELIWALPHEESFSLFQKGKVYENEVVYKNINDFVKARNSGYQKV